MNKPVLLLGFLAIVAGSSLSAQGIYRENDDQFSAVREYAPNGEARIINIYHLSEPGSQEGTVMDIDSNIYNIVKIGDQFWFKENLKTTHYRDGSEISGSGRYYWYDNNINNKKYDGALYNLPAFHNNLNLCPAGWHISTTSDWDRLEMFYGGKKTAGGQMKKLGDEDFTGILSGYMYSMDFFGSGEQSAWWTAEGEIRMVDSRYNPLYHTIVGTKERMALSVRCVKD
jgi:uncharacterized protein (TIGR02145 family)